MAPQSIVTEGVEEAQTAGPRALLRGQHDSIMRRSSLEAAFTPDTGSHVVIVPRGEQKLLLLENNFSL